MTVLVSIDGQDQVGKTTQINLLQERLENRHGYAVMIKRSPFNFPFNKIIRWMLSSGKARSWPNLFQALYILDRFLYQLLFLTYDMKHNDYIIFDRWKASGFAYGASENVWRWLLKVGERIIIEPNVTIVLTGKKKGRTEPGDTYDVDNRLQKQVALNYIIYSIINPNVVFIDADDLHAASKDILEAVFDVN